MRQRSDYPTFSDKEMARRHEAIENLMAQEGVDALLVYGTGRYASATGTGIFNGSRKAALGTTVSATFDLTITRGDLT